MKEQAKQLTQVDPILLKAEHAQRLIDSNNYFLREGLIHQFKLNQKVIGVPKKESKGSS